MAAVDDTFMGALEAAERELKATCGAGSSSAQTPATDAADGVVSPSDGVGDEPYAASDDEPDVPSTAAASSGHRQVERSGRSSDRHSRGSANAESRSTFKARVIKELKMGAAHIARQCYAQARADPRPHADPRLRRTQADCALRSWQRCVASTRRGGSLRRRTSRSWRASWRTKSSAKTRRRPHGTKRCSVGWADAPTRDSVRTRGTAVLNLRRAGPCAGAKMRGQRFRQRLHLRFAEGLEPQKGCQMSPLTPVRA